MESIPAILGARACNPPAGPLKRARGQRRGSRNPGALDGPAQDGAGVGVALRIVLRCAMGVSNSEVAGQLHVRIRSWWRKSETSLGCISIRRMVHSFGAPRKRVRSRRWTAHSRPGECARTRPSCAPHDYRRHGTTCLSRPLCHHGQGDRRDPSSSPQHRIPQLSRACRSRGPGYLDAHLVLDNYGTRKTPLIHRWLLRHPRFQAPLHLHL